MIRNTRQVRLTSTLWTSLGTMKWTKNKKRVFYLSLEIALCVKDLASETDSLIGRVIGRVVEWKTKASNHEGLLQKIPWAQWTTSLDPISLSLTSAIRPVPASEILWWPTHSKWRYHTQTYPSLKTSQRVGSTRASQTKTTPWSGTWSLCRILKRAKTWNNRTISHLACFSNKTTRCRKSQLTCTMQRRSQPRRFLSRARSLWCLLLMIRVQTMRLSRSSCRMSKKWPKAGRNQWWAQDSLK